LRRRAAIKPWRRCRHGRGFLGNLVERGGLLGRIVLRDDIRPQAKLVVDELRQSGLRTLVLTGRSARRRRASEN
jgi:cation transport ATPase